MTSHGGELRQLGDPQVRARSRGPAMTTKLSTCGGSKYHGCTSLTFRVPNFGCSLAPRRPARTDARAPPATNSRPMTVEKAATRMAAMSGVAKRHLH